MTEYDYQNLKFIMNSSDETLKDWYAQADADDIEYAQELMKTYSEELAVFKSTLDCFDIAVLDTHEAQFLLQNIFHP